jgi:hypothetical protein
MRNSFFSATESCATSIIFVMCLSKHADRVILIAAFACSDWLGELALFLRPSLNQNILKNGRRRRRMAISVTGTGQADWFKIGRS